MPHTEEPVQGYPTLLDILEAWIADAATDKEREARIAYGTAWVKGQHRLGVLSAEQMQRALHRLTAGHTMKKRAKPASF